MDLTNRRENASHLHSFSSKNERKTCVDPDERAGGFRSRKATPEFGGCLAWRSILLSKRTLFSRQIRLQHALWQAAAQCATALCHYIGRWTNEGGRAFDISTAQSVWRCL